MHRWVCILTNIKQDKHFHKIPDEALHAHTYNPKNLTKSGRRRNSTKNQAKPERALESEEEPHGHQRSRHHSPRRRRTESESDEEWERTNSTRDMHNSAQPPSSSSIPPASPFPIPPQYSREPPRVRTQYLPQQYEHSPYGGGRDDERYYSDSQRAPRRPKPVTRRSSSYHGPRRRSPSSSSESDSGSDRSRKHPSHTQIVKGRSSASHGDVIRDRSKRYGLKDETLGRFTKSPAGVTGSVVGGAIGAWAAGQAQVMIGRDQKKDKKRDQAGNKALSILGAAVGAMAVNAAMNKWEEGKKKDNKREDKVWEEKWGTDDEDGGGRSAGGRRGSRDSRSRESEAGGKRRDGEGGRRREKDYVGERDGRGYTPYGDPRDRH